MECESAVKMGGVMSCAREGMYAASSQQGGGRGREKGREGRECSAEELSCEGRVVVTEKAKIKKKRTKEQGKEEQEDTEAKEMKRNTMGQNDESCSCVDALKMDTTKRAVSRYRLLACFLACWGWTRNLFPSVLSRMHTYM